VLIIVLLIVLNPLFIISGSGISAVFRQVIVNEPCGVEIVGFADQSPVQEAGAQINEIIIKINDVEVNYASDLITYMDTYDSATDIILVTEANSYVVEPLLQNERYTLGVTVGHKMCKRSLGK
jgi:S1-C subfamily serine protease